MNLGSRVKETGSNKKAAAPKTPLYYTSSMQDLVIAKNKIMAEAAEILSEYILNMDSGNLAKYVRGCNGHEAFNTILAGFSDEEKYKISAMALVSVVSKLN